jgi:hypothetical protein
MTRIEGFDVRPLVRDLHPVRLAVEGGNVVGIHTPTMTMGRWIFLAVLAAFFCTAFVATYVWMRRPRFGDEPTRAFTGLEKTTEGGRPALLRTAAQRARTAPVEEKSARSGVA